MCLDVRVRRVSRRGKRISSAYQSEPFPCDMDLPAHQGRRVGGRLLEGCVFIEVHERCVCVCVCVCVCGCVSVGGGTPGKPSSTHMRYHS